MGNETLEGKLQDYFREESREFERQGTQLRSRSPWQVGQDRTLKTPTTDRHR